MENLENYKQIKQSINIYGANTFAFLLLIPAAIIFVIPYYFIWGFEFNIETVDDVTKLIDKSFIVLLIMILGIVIHELLHGAVWAMFTKHGFKSIKFGVMWKMLTPYCHCKEPLLVKHYIYGGIAPGIILGIIPCIIANIIGDSNLLAFGMFFTMAAGGDFLMINMIRKEGKSTWVQDHPSELGYYLYQEKAPTLS